VTLGLSAFACWIPSRASTLRFGAALATVVVLLPVALHLRELMSAYEQVLNGRALYGTQVSFARSAHKVLSTGGLFMWSQLFALLACWTVSKDPARRRFLLGLVSLFFFLVFCPLLFPFWVTYLTSAPVFWRMFLTLPLPVLAAYLLATPFAPARDQAYQRRPFLILALLISIIVATVPSRLTLSRSNRATIALPGLKVPQGEYAIAGLASELAPPGQSVLAPREIAMWIPTRPGSPRLVAMKDNYLKLMSPMLSEEEAAIRRDLFLYISGRLTSPIAPDRFTRALDDKNVGLMVLHLALPPREQIEASLREHGFIRETSGHYAMWKRL
jgi:hypothetical protein